MRIYVTILFYLIFGYKYACENCSNQLKKTPNKNYYVTMYNENEWLLIIIDE